MCVPSVYYAIGRRRCEKLCRSIVSVAICNIISHTHSESTATIANNIFGQTENVLHARAIYTSANSTCYPCSHTIDNDIWKHIIINCGKMIPDAPTNLEYKLFVEEEWQNVHRLGGAYKLVYRKGVSETATTKDCFYTLARVADCRCRERERGREWKRAPRCVAGFQFSKCRFAFARTDVDLTMVTIRGRATWNHDWVAERVRSHASSAISYVKSKRQCTFVFSTQYFHLTWKVAVTRERVRRRLWKIWSNFFPCVVVVIVVGSPGCGPINEYIHNLCSTIIYSRIWCE